VYYLFIYLFVLLIFGRYCLDILLFEKIQDYEEKTFSSSKREARQVTLDHVDPICFLPLVTLLHAYLKLNTYLIPLGLGLSGWVDLLSPTVLSRYTCLPSL
jgi:hypothetical protein